MFYLSKSKYCQFWQCPKLAWLNCYRPEEKTVDKGVDVRFMAGNEVGNLAKSLFGDFVDVTSYEDDRLNLSKMTEKTKEELSKGTPVICEASFSYKGLYCAVDILRKEDDGWSIYEVKSSTNSASKNEVKAVYVADISYQKYVLEHCGIKIYRTYLVCINSDYIRGDELDIHQLFYISDVSDLVEEEICDVEPNIELAKKILENKEEPNYDISEGCMKPYKCAFWEYCTKNIPEKSVFDLYRMPFVKKLDFYYKGLINYEDILNSGLVTNSKQLRQMKYNLEDNGTYVEKENIKTFLDKLSYPLYFLDFETMQPIIPPFKGTWPYQQIPFQYSLHYIENEGGELKHKEFLGVSGEDTRRAIAEALVSDIPMNVCVTAYNKAFECTRLKELAKDFPDLSQHLLNISENIVDLLEPFQSGYYYKREIGGSFSIKSVLPALFPDDPKLDYHNLDGVHNGSEAMAIFPQIQYMEPEEQKKARQNLLKYCELDTYAMVKVWEELVRVGG